MPGAALGKGFDEYKVTFAESFRLLVKHPNPVEAGAPNVLHAFSLYNRNHYQGLLSAMQVSVLYSYILILIASSGVIWPFAMGGRIEEIVIY